MTPIQLGVLKYIEKYIDTTGISPTYREIKEGCNLSAISHAHKIVDVLIKNAHLDMDPAGHRKIRRKADSDKHE